MPYTISFDKNNQIIHGIITGRINAQVLRQYTIEMDKVITQEKVNLILSDYRKAAFSFSVIELFYLPDKHEILLDSLGQNIHGLKRALLFEKRDDDLAHFFEDVAVNRGQKVKVFTDETAAINWLKNRPELQKT